MISLALTLVVLALWLVLRIGVPILMFLIDLVTLALGQGTFSGRALERRWRAEMARQAAAAGRVED